MKTNELIDLLAVNAGAASRGLVYKRVGAATFFGIGASTFLTIQWLGINPAISDMRASLLIKGLFVFALSVAAIRQLERAARPGASFRVPVAMVAFIVISLGVLACGVVLQAPPDARSELIFGHSWANCLWRLAALSVPAFAAAIWTLRGLAPTRLRMAGFSAGLFAGCAAALGYLLYCPETSPMFVFLWYSLGMAIPACIGYFAAPSLLRW